MGDNLRVLKWPWSLYGNEKEVVALPTKIEQRFTGANLIASVGRSSLRSSLEPLTEIVGLADRLHDIAHDSSKTGYFELKASGRKLVKLSDFVERDTLSQRQEVNYTDHWASFFEELYQSSESSENDQAYSWEKIRSFILESEVKGKEPNLALIVEIADKFLSTIQEIAQGMRAVLLRERVLQEVSKAREFDERIIQWIARRPGNSLREKIGAEKKVLSVRRLQSYDSFENRVLKDFLSRSIVESSRYVKRHRSQFQDSERLGKVKMFGQLCKLLLSDERFDSVSKPDLSERPSYSVLHNVSSRRIWKYYLRLLKLQEEREELWKWQGRTWAEICQLLIAVCFYSISEEADGQFGYYLESMLEGSPAFHYKLERGLRVIPGCEPGPFLLRSEDKRPLFIVDFINAAQILEHRLTEDLSSLGARMFLAFNPIDQFTSISPLVAIWSINAASTEYPIEAKEVFQSIHTALKRVNGEIDIGVTRRKVFGLVFINSKDKFDFELDDDSIIVHCPGDFELWADVIRDDLPLVLGDILEKFKSL